MKLIEAKDVIPGVEIDATHSMYPTRMLVAGGERGYTETDHTRHTYGYVLEGSCEVKFDGHSFTLNEGAYFSLPGRFQLIDTHPGLGHVRYRTDYVCERIVLRNLGAVTSKIILIQRFGLRGLVTVGRLDPPQPNYSGEGADRDARFGPGRLSYIDGCSDTLLVPPARLGEACLNYLFFPRGVLQTQHTHPSIRMGIVVDGLGYAWQQADGHGHGWEKPLERGNIFMLEESELHSFKTTEGHNGEAARTMSIVAFHPDSDTGPTDNDQPMLNRTYINHGQPGGQSGARI